ncbi:hypothetical protein IL306_007580 [Fusarium sp. DS 682]|nr:hypothetical protein IL306_007580 [Fusarium sp. DS 682]
MSRRASLNASDDEDVCDFCEELRYAHTSGTVFRFIASDKNLFMSSYDDEERPVKPNSQPAKSLYDLIENQSFCESRNINPLMPLIKAQRFNEKQRRALASRLALSLSLFLNSDYVLNASEASTVFFVIENGRCELDLVYATSTANKHDKNTPFNESMYLYDNLARILLEIEYGVSLKSLELGKVKSWVDDRLILNNEELGSDFHHDTVNIKDIEAKTSYLTAVRDLLNFKKTYRKGSRRLKGRLFDIGAIAGEVIFSDVAERLRGCIEPTQLRMLGLESSKEELLFQTLDNINIRKTGERKVVMRSAVRTTTHKNRTTPIQLFDDKDEIEEDKGLATKADFFFSQLGEFHESCEERASSIQSCSHKPVRIAVLDTGINQSSGAIKGGLKTRRIQPQNCRSWVGNDPNDVHDYHGHGTRIAELILRAAPEADIYVCKVFNGTSLQPNEVKGIAKAITYAVDVWDVDIISMSFWLTAYSLINDTKLQAAYKEIDVAIENAKSKIFFAAAANHGSHGPRTFPANHHSVICIHASDGKGKDGGISPEPEPTDDNFMTLGIALNFGDKRKSGTSYAAPMAASMAAYILYVAENLLDLPETAIDRLRTGRGMREMFRLMCGPSCSGGYRFVAPWIKLWTKDWHLDDDKIKYIETTVRTTHWFKF